MSRIQTRKDKIMAALPRQAVDPEVALPAKDLMSRSPSTKLSECSMVENRTTVSINPAEEEGLDLELSLLENEHTGDENILTPANSKNCSPVISTENLPACLMQLKARNIPVAENATCNNFPATDTIIMKCPFTGDENVEYSNAEKEIELNPGSSADDDHLSTVKKSGLPSALKNSSSGSSSDSSSGSSSDESSSGSSSSSTSQDNSPMSEDDDDDIRDKTYIFPVKNENSIQPVFPSSVKDDLSDSSESSDEDRKTAITRKRKSQPDLWKRTFAKRMRNSGKAYISRSKKVIKEKSVGPACNDKKCLHKCSQKISDDQRKAIFDEFWKTGDLQRHREFVLQSILTIEPKYRYTRENSHRNKNNAFYLTVHGRKTRVCKVFFKNTLAITDRFIRTVNEKKMSSPCGVLSLDGRGKHKNHRCTDPTTLKAIREHIDSIPRMESHYCRKDSRKEYIEGGRAKMDLYRDLVALWKTQHDTEPANYQMYAKVFNTEYNISFYQPKKDQCEDCVRYENATSDDKKGLEIKYHEHQKEKRLSRLAKEEDKEKAKADSNYKVLVYDLQAVLQCPRGDVSTFYYVSKLNAFNFTVCDLATNNVHCYTWDETQAKRGANEIATCLWMYIKGLEEKAVESKQNIDIVFYSDNCCGQNKNKFIFLMYEYAIRSFTFVTSITHNFLVKGHTQNEGDSAHATIQREITKSLKRGPIYTPQQYVTLMRTAKKTGKPYVVEELSHESIFDFKDLANKIKTCGFKNSNNENVRVSEIAVLRVEKEKPQEILYKYQYSDEHFQEIKMSHKRNTRGGATVGDFFSLKPLYDKPVGLDEKKKEGLLKLVDKNIIPKYYSSFYSSL